ncbi:hypothetical protein SAMN05216338_100193 [Bradyrhizobium sp. Rc2d]|nr:hypothetical protein SAMN05216338_100193 [Bradyrhizobium sp. Rc2d]
MESNSKPLYSSPTIHSIDRHEKSRLRPYVVVKKPLRKGHTQLALHRVEMRGA